MWQESCGTSKLSVAAKQLRTRTHTTILSLRVLLKLYQKSLKRKWKGKGFPFHAMKPRKSTGGIAPPILNLGTRLRWAVNITPRPLYLQRKTPRYPLIMRLGVFQCRAERFGEETHLQRLPRFGSCIVRPVVEQLYRPVAYRGGGWGGPNPSPQKFRRPSKIVTNSTRLWKLLEIVEFRTPTHQDVRKKGSKILKLPRFAIVLH